MNIEQMVEQVVKRINTTALGDTALHPEKAAVLVREIEKSTPLLTAARRLTMNSDKRDIDRVGFRSRIMGAAPTEGNNATNVSTPTMSTNQLSAVKAVAVVELTDEALEDNIERENFDDTLLALIGERAGIDLEELYINGDTDPATDDDYLELTDGWLKLAGHQLEGGGGTPDFDATDVEDMFEIMLTTMLEANPEFLRRREDFAFWTTWKAENDYREALRERGTSLGDEAQTQSRPLAYKGFPVVPVFNVPTGRTLLAGASNLVYGLRRDIRLETERQARAGRTDFIVTFRTDAHYEDERGAVAADGYTGVVE